MLVYVKLLLTAIFWGGTFISGRLLAQDAGPFSAAFLRFVAATLFLVPLCWRMDGGLSLPRGRQLPIVFLLGATGVFAYNVCFFLGLKTVPASRAALIVAMNPVAITLLSAWLFKETLTARRMLGTLLCVTGAMTVISRGNPTQLLSGGAGFGELAILGCVASWAAYSVAGKYAMRDLSPVASVTWSSAAGALLLLPFAAHEALQTGWLFPARAWINIAYLGVFGTGLGFSWYYQGIQAIGPSRASVFINFVPVSAILMAAAILGEKLDASLVAGGVLVCCGAWLVNRRPKQVIVEE